MPVIIKPSTENIIPTATADLVYTQSVERAVAKEVSQTSQPTIINAPTTNNQNNTTSPSAPRGGARNNESSLLQYNRSRFDY
jgi:hypothetical protein